jgi:hypothetical protein
MEPWRMCDDEHDDLLDDHGNRITVIETVHKVRHCTENEE